MKALRTALGLTLLAGGLYVLIGEHLAGTSADATLNARLYVVRAPIEGRVALAVRNIGAKVKQGELIADIADQRFDTARLLVGVAESMVDGSATSAPKGEDRFAEAEQLTSALIRIQARLLKGVADRVVSREPEAPKTTQEGRSAA
jgi:multidrug resistance efflux pump